jgi:hypothetical protein
MLTPVEWAAVTLEVSLLGYIGWRAARSIRRVRSRLREGDSDAFGAIRTAARETIRLRWAAEALAQEMAMFYYAFFCWRMPPPPEGEGFSSYRKNSYGIFLFAIVTVLVIETIAIHLLVYFLWSGAVALIFTAISLYTLIWMIGDWQALRLRRTTISSDRINIRLGTRWEVEIPRNLVISVGTPKQLDDDVRPLKLVLIGDPNVEIRLTRPVTARGMYGLRRTSSIVRLQVDESTSFIDQARPSAVPGQTAGTPPADPPPSSA